MTSFDLQVSGLSCGGCVGRVEAAIMAIPEVEKANVNLASGRTRVWGGDPGEVVAAIRDAGYCVIEDVIRLRVTGMHCAGCAGRVERALTSIPAVRSASVNLVMASADVTILAGAIDAQTLASRLSEAGYQAAPEAGERAASEDRQEIEARSLRRAALAAGVITAPLAAGDMAVQAVPAVHHGIATVIGTHGWSWLSLLLSSLVLFGPGCRFFRTGLAALARRAPDMNTLVAIGAGAAWTYSALVTLAPGFLSANPDDIYFESAAVIVTFILIGRWLEAEARGRAGQAIRRLMMLQPEHVHRLVDETVEDVAVETLLPGHVVVVLPGERVPVDGVVLAGVSFVDEALITGESMPRRKAEGMIVLGGTLNTTGTFRFRVTHVGARAALGRIVRLVQDAQASKLPVQALVDRITAWFVPLVIGIALITFAAWLVFAPAPAFSTGLVHAVTVLIVACPCAMGLATPAAIVVATGRAAQLGILFRRGDALQALGNVRTVAFDKTGTLTEGRPALAELVVAPGVAESDVLASAAAVERNSEHPVAGAIVGAAEARGLVPRPADGFEAIPGLGAEATVDGKAVLVGSRHFMDERGIDTAGFTEHAKLSADQGRTPIFVAVDGRTAALLTVSDPVKASAGKAIDVLTSLGVDPVMVSGDDHRVAQAVARALGIAQVTAEVRPEDKLRVVRGLIDAEGSVAFVGDGLNDAPALAAATVGIAIGAGADVAIESADVVLMHSDPRDVATAIAISRATMRNIRQNLAWAFGYNVILLPVATGLFAPLFGWSLSPMLAAAAMALSSVSVLLNALRLRRFSSPVAMPLDHPVRPNAASARLVMPSEEKLCHSDPVL